MTWKFWAFRGFLKPRKALHFSKCINYKLYLIPIQRKKNKIPLPSMWNFQIIKWVWSYWFQPNKPKRSRNIAEQKLPLAHIISFWIQKWDWHYNVSFWIPNFWSRNYHLRSVSGSTQACKHSLFIRFHRTGGPHYSRLISWTFHSEHSIWVYQHRLIIDY